MTLTLFTVFAILAALVLGLASLALARAPAARAASFGLAVLALLYGYGAGAELLGRPKPLRLAGFERTLADATVIASTYEEGRAIYLWLMLPGREAPRAYVMPWSQAAAEDLLRAEEEAEANGTRVRLRNPFRPGEDGAEGFFDAPALPPPPVKSGV